MNKILKGIGVLAIIATPILNISSSEKISRSTLNNVTKLDKSNILTEDKERYLRNEISKNRIYGGDITYSEYDNKKFFSKETLEKYILDNNKVVPILTSSNPYKIIKNFEHMTLDENKVYDTDIDNFIPVYRDAFGNISHNEKDSLNTYTNKGLVKPEFSYDGINWYDSAEEAKIKEKYNLKINKSLYYIYNNRYYNAFNPNDIEELVSSMDNGYYIDMNSDLNNKKLSEPLNYYGDSRLFYDLTKKEFNKFFNIEFMGKITKIKRQIRVGLKAKGDRDISIDWAGTGMRHMSDNEFTLVLADTERTAQIKTPQDFHEYWTSCKYWYKRPLDHGKITRGRDEYIIDDDGTVKKIIINLNKANMKSYANCDDVIVRDLSVGDIKLYPNETQQDDRDELLSTGFKRNVYNINQITNDDRQRFFNKWFDVYYYKNIVNFGPSNANKDVTFEDIKNDKLIKADVKNNDTIGKVFKDKSYDINYNKGQSRSLLKTYQNWKDIKTKILNSNDTKKSDTGETLYNLKNVYWATKKQLDNFLYLEGNIPMRVMYSYSDTPDVSDPEGRELAQSLEEAREKQIVNSKMTLRKRFVAHDVFGNQQSVGYTKESAIERLQNRISLTSKLVHKNEAKQWNKNLKYSWDSIISDGRYVIYRVEDSSQNNSYIYFPSQDMAMNAIKVKAKINSDVNKLTTKVYMYNYTMSNGEVKPIIFYGDDIDLVINKIKELESNIKKN